MSRLNLLFDLVYFFKNKPKILAITVCRFVLLQQSEAFSALYGMLFGGEVGYRHFEKWKN
jgi:hypothetical protein